MKGGLYLLNQTSANIHIIIVQDLYRTVWCSNLQPRDVFHYTHHNNARFYVVMSDGNPISVGEMNKFIEQRNRSRKTTAAIVTCLIVGFVAILALRFLSAYAKDGHISCQDSIEAVGEATKDACEYTSEVKLFQKSKSRYTFDRNNKIRQLFSDQKGNVYKRRTNKEDVFLRIPGLECLEMESQNSHYLKFTKCFAIRGGPKFNKGTKMMPFQRLREVRVDQDYIQERYYQIRGADYVKDSQRYFTNKDPGYLKVDPSHYASRPSPGLGYEKMKAIVF